jgi:hypothetical protein
MIDRVLSLYIGMCGSLLEVLKCIRGDIYAFQFLVSETELIETKDAVDFARWRPGIENFPEGYLARLSSGGRERYERLLRAHTSQRRGALLVLNGHE